MKETMKKIGKLKNSETWWVFGFDYQWTEVFATGPPTTES